MLEGVFTTAEAVALKGKLDDWAAASEEEDGVFADPEAWDTTDAGRGNEGDLMGLGPATDRFRLTEVELDGGALGSGESGTNDCVTIGGGAETCWKLLLLGGRDVSVIDATETIATGTEAGCTEMGKRTGALSWRAAGCGVLLAGSI
jgi:hypothetical protein